MKKINIVVPCYKEQDGLNHFYLELHNSISNIPDIQFNILFVNDGSPDGTLDVIKSICSKDPMCHWISFSRNFGHQAAIDAGLKASSKADAVIMLDADLQHPPKYIEDFISYWLSGYDIVNTKRLETGKISAFKRLSSDGFYWVFNKLSDTSIEPGTSDFRLLDKKVVSVVNSLHEKHKFFRGLVSWVGFKTKIIDYVADERKFGQSSYTLKKMLTLAHEGITSFSMKPLKLILTIGILTMIFGMLGFSFMLIYKYCIDYKFFTGPAVLAMFIILNNGLLITLIGIIANYQIMMQKEIQGRPNYIISEEMLD